MFNFSLKNRIAFYYIISAAMLIFVVFITIYSLISYSVYSKVNEHINYEVNEYIEQIEFNNNIIQLKNKEEWEQREHNEVSVNPVFLEIKNKFGKTIEKSSNLKKTQLTFSKNLLEKKYSDVKLSGKLIRQAQVPLYIGKGLEGFLLVAVSIEEETATLENLKTILYISFPFILLILFILARLIAGRSIKPINSVIETSNAITKDNLYSRIELPKNKDELYTLSLTINNLLDRIENTIEREKQFTSDASHELRTPLAVIKGTMEVLIRKPREKQEYEDKIHFCIAEIDRLNNLVDQLLLLARFENQKKNIKKESVHLNSLLLDATARFCDKIKDKNISINSDFDNDFYVESDSYLLPIILSNIISNAIKYSKNEGAITVVLSKNSSNVICSISDNGIGIPKDELDKVFDSFYRSKIINNPEIKGTGLGLSIVKRLCDLLNITILIESKEATGTSVILSFH